MKTASATLAVFCSAGPVVGRQTAPDGLPAHV